VTHWGRHEDAHIVDKLDSTRQHLGDQESQVTSSETNTKTGVRLGD
jgi:hypothetical protein